MKTKTLLASIALASLAVAQPVAAATRSAQSLPTSGVQAAPAFERASSLDAESEELRGRRSPLLLIVGLFALMALLVVATTGSKSPG